MLYDYMNSMGMFCGAVLEFPYLKQKPEQNRSAANLQES